MNRNKILFTILLIIALSGWSMVAISIVRGVEDIPFDHSQCQYPNRESNPPDGCDNSDPARPECMKSGIEDCGLPTQESQPTLPVTVVKEVIVKTCQ